jgi:hypothetical protein
MLQHKTVEWEDERMKVVITVQESTVMMGIRRGELIDRVLKETPPDAGNYEKIVRIHVYPICVSCTSSIEVIPKPGVELAESEKSLSANMTWETFSKLPDKLAMLWEKAATGINPQWLPQKREEAPNAVRSDAPTGTDVSSSISEVTSPSNPTPPSS